MAGAHKTLCAGGAQRLLGTKDGAVAGILLRPTTAFHEDKRIIEAQQKLIDLEPGRAMLPTSLDAGPTQFRKLVEAMSAAG